MPDSTPDAAAPQSLTPAQQKVAMRDPAHLIAWLQQTGRHFVIFEAEDLVRSQAWPHGIEALMEIIAAYTAHRGTIESGEIRKVPDLAGGVACVPAYKGDALEPAEMERCIRWLMEQMRRRCPGWSLEGEGSGDAAAISA